MVKSANFTKLCINQIDFPMNLHFLAPAGGGGGYLTSYGRDRGNHHHHLYLKTW